MKKQYVIFGLVGFIVVLTTTLSVTQFQSAKPVGEIGYLELKFAGDMSGEVTFTLDKSRFVTKTINDYVSSSTEVVSKNVIQDADIAHLNDILLKYNVYNIISDTNRGPDMTYSSVKITQGQKSHEHVCLNSKRDCTKLAEELRTQLNLIVAR